MVKRFYYSDCSNGERATLLDILAQAATELADNPSKYHPEKFNEYNEQQDFYFKPSKTKYCKFKFWHILHTLLIQVFNKFILLKMPKIQVFMSGLFLLKKY